MTALSTARAVGAIAALLLLAPLAAADLVVHLGTFRNEFPINGDTEYTGEWADYIDDYRVDGPGPHTVVEVDLHGLLSHFEGLGVIGFSIVDGGQNEYGSSPGADIDLAVIEGPGDSATGLWTYDGPNGTHADETSAELLQRVAAIDAAGGDQDDSAPHFVSLGQGGSLDVFLDAPVWGPGSSLLFSEAGRPEDFDVYVTLAPVPAPASAAILFGLGLGGRRRRR